jgi:hypothetical protein
VKNEQARALGTGAPLNVGACRKISEGSWNHCPSLSFHIYMKRSFQQIQRFVFGRNARLWT